MFQALPSIPNPPLWLELVKAGVGPVLAAIFVVVGLIWRDWIERRNAAQEWFEQTYITKGIDVLISYLKELHDAVFQFYSGLGSPVNVSELPTHVKWRVETVIPAWQLMFGVQALGEAVKALGTSGNETTRSGVPADTSLIQFAYDLLTITQQFRIALLRIQVKVKSDIYDSSRNRHVKGVIEALQNRVTMEEVSSVQKFYRPPRK